MSLSNFSEGRSHVPTSVLLDDIVRRVPRDHVSLGWLLEALGQRSFGIVMLLMGLLGAAPGVSGVVGVLLFIPAYQMIVARSAPTFSRALSDRRLPRERVIAVLRRAVPVLRYLERFIRPRWQTPFEATKRVVGLAILLLGITLLAPIPLSNVPPALVIVLIAFAYLEEDGVLLTLALLAGLVLLGAIGVAAWGTAAATFGA